MPWSKLKDKEPANKNDEYFLRNGGDKYIGWWDNEEKEFYMIEQSCKFEYFEKDQYPNIEWWDEEEVPSQDKLWDELQNILIHYEDGYSSGPIDNGPLEHLKTIYTLTRK
jgi:hypothetical protein